LGTSLACPQISGKFDCNGNEVAVETFELDGVKYLEINGQGLPADGNWLDLPDSENERNAKIRLTCGDNERFGGYYLLDYEADLYEEGEKYAFLDVESYFHMEGEDFKETTEGLAKGEFGEVPVNSVNVCKKK
jgi:hypothetical protein